MSFEGSPPDGHALQVRAEDKRTYRHLEGECKCGDWEGKVRYTLSQNNLKVGEKKLVTQFEEHIESLES